MMLYPGSQMYTAAMFCPSCNMPAQNRMPAESLFLLYACGNLICDMNAAIVTVEKRTMTVIAVSRGGTLAKP